MTDEAYNIYGDLLPKERNMAWKPRTIGEFVAYFRGVHELSMRDLAAKIGVTYPYVANIEHDKYDMPIEFCKRMLPLMSAKEKAMMYDALLSSIQARVEEK
jgi:transcriptional regulator with XRE-family HTH domain